MGKKETLKCIPALNDRDERPSCLFGASAKSALDFFLDHSLPRMQSCSYWNYQVSMRFCSWLKASSIRGLNSILPLQISIINHVIFFPSLQFPNNICMSTETVAVHNERSDTFNGTDSSLWRGTKGECWLSLIQRFRRLRRLMVRG